MASEALSERRRRPDRRRGASRRPVDDADEDARRPGDDGADRRAGERRLRDRARRGAEERGRRRAAEDRALLADPGDRRHPLQREPRAARDRRRRRGRPHQPRQHRRRRQGRARSCAPRRPRASRCGSARTPARCRSTSRSSPSEDQAEALVEAALEEVRLLEQLDYRDFKISVKSSHVPTMIRAYRLLAGEGAVPAAPRRDRGGHAVRRLDQERRRHGRAARRRDRRHDPRLARRPTRSRR